MKNFLISSFIIFFLFCQNYPPIKYYYSRYFEAKNNDSYSFYDERWTWRMFSSVRQLYSCEVNFFFSNQTNIPLKQGLFKNSALFRFFFFDLQILSRL